MISQDEINENFFENSKGLPLFIFHYLIASLPLIIYIYGSYSLNNRMSNYLSQIYI